MFSVSSLASLFNYQVITFFRQALDFSLIAVRCVFDDLDIKQKLLCDTSTGPKTSEALQYVFFSTKRDVHKINRFGLTIQHIFCLFIYFYFLSSTSGTLSILLLKNREWYSTRHYDYFL